MPNRLSLLSANPQVTHNPTTTINADPLSILGNPFLLTPQIIIDSVNILLGYIDDATGLDLLGLVTPLETLLGTSTNLLSGFFGFLTPGLGTTGLNVFSPLLSGMGLGSLGGLTSFLQPTALLAGGGVFAPLLNLLSLGNLGALGSFLSPTTLLTGGGIFAPLLSLFSLGNLGAFGTFLSPTLGSTGTTVFSPILSGLGLSSLTGLLGFLNPSTLLAGGGIFGPLLSLLSLSNLGGLGSFLAPTLGSTGTNVFSPVLGGLGLANVTGLLGFLNPTTLLTGGGVFAPLLGLLGLANVGALGSFLQPTNLTSAAGIFAPLLSSGTLLLSLIPTLPLTQVANLATLLSGFGTSTSILTQLLGQIPGLTGGLSGLSGFGSVLTDLTHLLGSPTALGSGTPVLPGVSSIPLLGGLFSGGSILTSLLPAIPTSLLFGLLSPANLPLISASHIGNVSPNLLVNSTFDTAGALSGQGIWNHDATVGHTTAGSASVVANGTGQKDLLSNLIPVTQGQVLDFSAWVKWTSIAFTGAPIVLGITAYLNGAAVAQPNTVTLAPNTGTSSWQQLSGSYTVPSGVDNVRVRLSVLPGATAGTVWFDDVIASKSGLMPTSLVNGLDTQLGSITGNVTSLFSGLAGKAALGDFNNLLTSLGGGSGGFTTIENRLLGMLTSSSTVNAGQIGGTGSIASTFIPDLVTTQDSIVNQLLGAAGNSWGNTAVSDALGQHTAALTGLASQVAKLNNTFTSGVSFGDNFEYPAGPMNSNWSVTYPTGSAGTIHTDGHYLAYVPSGTGDRTFVARWNANQTSTDYQLVQAVFGSAPQTPFIPIGNPAGNRVLSRVSADNLNYVYAEWINGNCNLVRVVNGIETLLQSVPWPTPVAGSMIAIQAGKPGTARFFIPIVNGQHCFEHPEVGVASMVGANYRYTGVGGKAGGWLFALTQSLPGKMNHFTGADQ